MAVSLLPLAGHGGLGCEQVLLRRGFLAFQLFSCKEIGIGFWSLRRRGDLRKAISFHTTQFDEVHLTCQSWQTKNQPVRVSHALPSVSLQLINSVSHKKKEKEDRLLRGKRIHFLPFHPLKFTGEKFQ